MQKMKLLFIDVKKAHLNGIVQDDEHVFVDLPPESDIAAGKCGNWNVGYTE